MSMASGAIPPSAPTATAAHPSATIPASNELRTASCSVLVPLDCSYNTTAHGEHCFFHNAQASSTVTHFSMQVFMAEPLCSRASVIILFHRPPVQLVSAASFAEATAPLWQNFPATGMTTETPHSTA